MLLMIFIDASCLRRSRCIETSVIPVLFRRGEGCGTANSRFGEIDT